MACKLGVVSTCHDIYNFKVDLEVHPTSETYTVGDTIRISMTTDNTQLYDGSAFRTVGVPDFNPQHRFMLPRLDTFLIMHDGLISNEVIVPSEYIIEYVDNEDDPFPSFLALDTIQSRPDSSFMEIAIVLNEPGTFALMSRLALHWYHLYDTTTEVSDRCSERIDLTATPYFYEQRWYNEHILTEKNRMVVDSMKRNIADLSYQAYYYFNVVE